MELVIDGFIDTKHKVKKKISQGSPASPILCDIYQWRIFWNRNNPATVHLFIICRWSGQSVFEIQKMLKKASEIILNWRTRNAVIYNISKTEVILFFKA